MKILVFQHHPEEHPGIFRQFLAADNIAWDAVELDAGEPIPNLDGYDALWAMGGPMDVWQEDEHPWLKAEKAAIREAVWERKMPYLGVCLGHQLLVDALGGTVSPMPLGEVGVLPINLTQAGAADPLFGPDGGDLMALQWHSAEVTELPEGGTTMASSPVSPCQAVRVGGNAYGIQYHVEVTEETVPLWVEIPEYKAALEKSIGAHALPAFSQAVNDNMAGFQQSARRIYDGFKALL